MVKLAPLAALAALVLAHRGVAQDSGPIDPARLSETVRLLASDDFQGRAPGTAGEAKTIAYLVVRFQALGVAPGGEGGTYLQAVPLVHTRIAAPAAISIATRQGITRLSQSRDVYFSTVRDVDRATIAKAPMIFVGYGVHAPERDWDDFKGVDLHGKVAIFLVNDPDYGASSGDPVAGRFGGKLMTYYGRWTYKYEEAARRGAIAALIVHEAAGAGYGWATVIAPGGENYDVVRSSADERVLLQGWLDRDAARSLFAKAGLDFERLRVAARSPDFRPVMLSGETLSVDVPVTTTHVASHNVLAKIVGAGHPDETILFAAHWDAYGTGPADAAGRTVRAGAADDAIGVAGVLELARAFAAGPKPDRTLVFAAWSAEERGLLGSESYASRPLYPLTTTVADLTMDVLQTAGPAHDVVLVGNGQTDLEDRLAAAAARQGRTITPEALPERGLYYRADHFSVARRGVPSLLLMGMSGGHDLVAGGRAAGDAWLEGYMQCYHQACDVWHADWDLRGAAQDVALYYDIGRDLANSRAWPGWRAGAEFKAIRDATAAKRR
ncbi:M20/M25/M40 family metallo-hydrolase [Sphingomonas bacterium]|uniref:M20/M25/M40 family metallo-hydrolase n=1 Tax=Sphingomonas bacterium TaxID=1895847 RepID=UPI00157672EE|nr:M20/M25/M40 family metallo-hydrolase [Sphingomonas bacterium]